MVLAQLNQTLEKKIKVIDHNNQRLIVYMVEPQSVPALERLSSIYDERFYCACLNNIELVRKYFNNSIEIMNRELGFVDVTTGDELIGLSNTFNSSLDLYSFETDISLFLKDLDNGIENYSRLLDIYLGDDKNVEPESIIPEGRHWKPLDQDVVSNGYTRIFEYPVPGWSNTQGVGFDKDHYYAFGQVSGTETNLRLAVIDKNDPDKSFVARGDIGDYTDYKNYMLGHTNDCTVMYQKGDEVTLLVSSMIPGEVATAIVNLKTQTVRYGKRIPVVGSKGEKIGAVTSSQLIDNNRVILKASSYYWVAKFNETKMELVKFIKSNNASVLKIVKEKFGENYFDGIAGQSDWFENGYLYTIAWSGDWKKCVVFEMIPQGPDDWAIPSNRYWWGEEANRRFEPEKVWIENGKFMITVSMNGPYDNFIAEMNWKN